MESDPLPIDRILDAPYPAVASLVLDVEINVPGLRATTGRLDLDMLRTPPAIVTGNGGWEDAKVAIQASQSTVPGRLIEEDELGNVRGARSESPEVLTLCGCLCGSTTFGSQGMRAEIQFQTVDLGSVPVDTPVVAAYVLRGFTLDMWPVYRALGDRGRREILNTAVLGEPVVIRQIDGDYARLIFLEQRTYEGRPASELAALWQWLSFVVGRPVQVVQEEAFAPMGNLVFSRTYPVQTHPLQRAMPPVPLSPVQDRGTETIWQLDEIIQNGYPSFRSWCRLIFLLEAVHHLHSGVRAHLESRFAMYAIAFETLASSFARHQGGNVQATAHYFDRPTFKRVIKAARKAFKAAFNEHADTLADPDGTLKTMEGKLLAINERAMQDRFRTLLTSLRLVPSTAELRVLARRNTAIHEGVLGRDRDALDVQSIVDAENTLLTLLHKIVLRLVGYEGPIVDYGSDGYPTIELSDAMSLPVDLPEEANDECDE
ncbi:MAG TPA: hypothetical protein VGB53_13525 [Rubricoccaceae bacterium]